MRSITILLFFCAQAVFGQTNQFFTIGKYDKLYSKILNRDRDIIVHVPKSSNQNIKNETYPVLFLLDGDYLFTKTVGIIDHLSSVYGGEKCPKMIIVGITHPNRNKDLLPTIINNNPDNNDQFADFLEKELIPYIDKNYPTQPYRLLVGHSLGGYRAANTLVYNPQIFNSYIALDPSLGFDMNVWSFRTDEVLKNKMFKNKSLFVAMAHTMPVGMDTAIINKDTSGAARHMRAIMRFCNGMNNYKVSGVDFNWKYYPNEPHSGVTFLGLYDGLNSIFSWYSNKNLYSIFDKTVTTRSAISIVKEHYENISKNMGFVVLPPEQSIYETISYLMSKNMVEKAEAFAEMNAKNYPTSESAKNNLREIKWNQKKSLAELLLTKTAQQIDELCIIESKKLEPEYNISENAINTLGYQLLEQQKNNDALIIFKTNLELYPKSANVWDSYGECLLLLGKEKEGIKAYKKSLELDPANSNAATIIKKHGQK